MAKRLTTTVLVGAVLAAMSGSASANVDCGMDQLATQTDQRYRPLVQWFASHPSEFKLFMKSLGNLRGEIDDYEVQTLGRELGVPSKILVIAQIDKSGIQKKSSSDVKSAVGIQKNSPTDVKSAVGTQKKSTTRPRCW
jgi:hypothetical protein